MSYSDAHWCQGIVVKPVQFPSHLYTGPKGKFETLAYQLISSDGLGDCALSGAFGRGK